MTAFLADISLFFLSPQCWSLHRLTSTNVLSDFLIKNSLFNLRLQKLAPKEKTIGSSYLGSVRLFSKNCISRSQYQFSKQELQFCTHRNSHIKKALWNMSPSYLQDADIGNTIGSDAASIDHNVFQPLNVRLWVAEHFAFKLHVAAHHYGTIGRQTSLQDRPVWGALCNTAEGQTNLSLRHTCTCRRTHGWEISKQA